MMFTLYSFNETNETSKCTFETVEVKRKEQKREDGTEKEKKRLAYFTKRAYVQIVKLFELNQRKQHDLLYWDEKESKR